MSKTSAYLLFKYGMDPSFSSHVYTVYQVTARSWMGTICWPIINNNTQYCSTKMIMKLQRTGSTEVYNIHPVYTWALHVFHRTQLFPRQQNWQKYPSFTVVGNDGDRRSKIFKDAHALYVVFSGTGSALLTSSRLLKQPV
jgi:hypothetical protein